MEFTSRVVHLRDEPCELLRQDALLIVTNYKCDDPEGSGNAYILLSDNKTVEEHNLTHCSCWGPWDNNHKTWSLTEFKNLVTSPDVTVGTIEDLATAKRFLEELERGQAPRGASPGAEPGQSVTLTGEV